MNLLGMNWVILLERVGIALVHSLWQGALVGLALMIGLVALRRAHAQVRYVACCLALATTLLLPVCTFFAVPAEGGFSVPAAGSVAMPADIESQTAADPIRFSFAASAAAALEAAVKLMPAELSGDSTEQIATHADGAEDVPAAECPALENTVPQSTAVPENIIDRQPAARPRWLSPPAQRLLLAIVAAWSVGVILLSCRVLGGYVVALRMTRRLIAPVDDAWQARFRQLARRLGIERAVELWQSTAVEVPAVIGCFRPVILLPIGMLTGLSVAHVESILAHELAHVRRHDFLVNAVQSLIETLLFYHPCVWWISARIRAEREHCCDEMAVEACGDALLYARALTGLEELRPPPRLAMALSGGGPLLWRIRRIVGRPRAGDVIGGWLAGSLAIILPLAVGGTWACDRAAWGRVDSTKADFAVASPLDKSAMAQQTVARPTDIDNPNVDDASPSAPAASDSGPPPPTDSFSVSLAKIPAGPLEARVAGGPMVSFLVPQRPGFNGPPADFVPRMVEEHGSQRVVQVVVSGLPGDAYNYVYDHLWRLLPNLTYFGTSEGDTVTVHLAPIDDLDSFAARIDLGEVRSIDRGKRLITVVADRSRLPRPQAAAADALAGDADLDTLCQRLVDGERTAVEGLVAFGPEAELAVAPYAKYEERRVRRAALLVLKRVATDASLPVLLAALADDDLGNRDLAWQAICHVPGLTERQEVMEAAGAAISRHPEQTAKWLATIGPAAESLVWPSLRHDDPGVRLAAASLLAQIGTGKSVPALEAMAGDEVEQVARAAVKAREAIARRQP